MKNVAKKFTVPLLVVAMSCLPLLGSNGALLTPMAGTISVNGRSVTSDVLVPGDNVSVSPDGSAQLSFNGASVVAAAKTQMRMLSNGKSIALTYGGLEISGAVPVVAGNRTITPLSSDARYSINSLGRVVYVIAHSGNLKIAAFGKSYTVREGEAATFQDQDQNNNNQGGAAAAGGTDQGATTTTTTTAAGTTGGTMVALPVTIGIAAAAAVVTGIIVHSATASSSPSE